MALVASAKSNSPGTDSAATSGVDTTGATLLVLVTSAYAGGTAPTVSDSKGNTWTGLTTRDGSFNRCRIWYCIGGTVGAGHTFTVSGTGSYPDIIAYAFDLASPAYDAENGAVQASSASSLQPGAVTPSSGTNVVVTGLSNGNDNSTATISGTFSAPDGYPNNSGALGNVPGWGSYDEDAAGSPNPTWSWTNNVVCTAAIAAFVAGGGGGGSIVPLVMHHRRTMGRG